MTIVKVECWRSRCQWGVFERLVSGTAGASRTNSARLVEFSTVNMFCLFPSGVKRHLLCNPPLDWIGIRLGKIVENRYPETKANGALESPLRLLGRVPNSSPCRTTYCASRTLTARLSESEAAIVDGRMGGSCKDSALLPVLPGKTKTAPLLSTARSGSCRAKCQ